MKAIIISDDNETIDVVDKILNEYNFNTIIYRWLLKALDNIEEIRPDLVIVSVNEYPRHWKTLTQFVASGIGGEKTKIMLLCQTPLSEEERKKASALGVKGFFSGVDENGISQLKSFLGFYYSVDTNYKVDENTPTPTVTESPKVDDTVPEEPEIIFDVSDAVLIFTNPYSGKIVTGKVHSYKSKIVELAPENRAFVTDLKQGDKIDALTFELDSKVQNYTASIVSIAENIFIRLEKEID